MASIKSPFRKRTLNTKILELLARRGEMRACNIKGFLSPVHSDINGALLRLLEEKLVERVSRGVYKITDKGKQKIEDGGV